MSARKPIVVVGSINMDLVADTPRIPRPGETLTGTNFTTTPGGKGANQAVAVARLGYPVYMVGMVGEDVFGQALLDNLIQAGVTTEAVARVPGPSGVAPILVSATGENSIVVVPGANGKVTPAFIDQQKALISSAGMVLCQLELPIETVSHTLTLCADAGVPVTLDPAPAAPLPQSAWAKVTWFTPNETEAAFYLDDSQLDPETAAEKLLSRGLQGVILKRGSEGAWVAQNDRHGTSIPPFPVEAVDTVAAGDCFNGAFAVALLEGRDPVAAAKFASAAAAISVTRRGAQASMPNRADVESFLSRRS
jgi:ribokinase